MAVNAWKRFDRNVHYDVKRHRKLYLLEIKNFPDMVVDSKTDAEKTCKAIKKLGLKCNYKKIKNGYTTRILSSKFVVEK